MINDNRTRCWRYSIDGQLEATLYLTDEEFAKYTHITTVEPPEQTVTHRAFWVDDTWSLVQVTPFPLTINSTTVLANNLDTITLEDLPIPCTVTVANTVYEVDDGTLEISFDTPGEYQITVSAFPYLDKTFTVEAI